jgi:hypothetical protein
VSERFDGGIDIDGVAYSVVAEVSDPFSADDLVLVDVTITVPGLEPWAADQLMRAISESYANTPSPLVE